MKKIYGNPCCRCGKERIHVRTWKERVGNSTIINVEHACPDKLCQQKVDAENKKQGQRYAQMKAQSEQRAEERKKVRTIK